MIINSEKIAKMTSIPTSEIVNLAMRIAIVVMLTYLFLGPPNFDED